MKSIIIINLIDYINFFNICVRLLDKNVAKLDKTICLKL